MANNVGTFKFMSYSCILIDYSIVKTKLLLNSKKYKVSSTTIRKAFKKDSVQAFKYSNNLKENILCTSYFVPCT